MSRAKLVAGSADDIESAFYDALARADIEALMALWAEEDEIVCIHPNAPRLVGYAAIRASWEAVFEQGGVHIRPRQLHAVRNPMSAVHSVLEEINRPGAGSHGRACAGHQCLSQDRARLAHRSAPCVGGARQGAAGTGRQPRCCTDWAAGWARACRRRAPVIFIRL